VSGDGDVSSATASETRAAAGAGGSTRVGPGEADIRAFEALYGRTDQDEAGAADDPAPGPSDRDAAPDQTADTKPRSGSTLRERAGVSWQDQRPSLQSSSSANRAATLQRSLRDGRDLSSDSREGGGLDASAVAASAEPPSPLVQVVSAVPEVRVAAGDVTEVAALLERYVRQLAVSSGDARDPGVLLRMSAAALPDTDMVLRRTAQGWKLQVTSGSASALETLEQHAPALIARFARADLGTLEIEQRSRRNGDESGQG